ncbi:DUF2750 domain-containing protein [Chryseobacterium sp. CT-SW4]|uniref:DUF2750 domain-containing protein n=1 Tax=Chryseobacterium sp. SW-1 TaxID=3157343 RepID=UPI003B01B24C
MENVNRNRLENILKLEPLKRYQYFIKYVADWEVFYTLTDKNGNYILSELEGQKLFPVWSAEEFVKLCMISGWEGTSIKKMNLDDLENEIIDFVANSDYLFNVFPVHDKTGFVVNLDEFSRDLSEELKNYE